MTKPHDREERREGPTLRVANLTKQFVRHGGAEVRAIDDTTFDAEYGEFIVLLGPSGCGKTTLLRCIAGLERPDGGSIEIQGRTVYSSDDGVFVGPERRGISMVFQSYALWPHMSASDNVAYPLKYGRAAMRMKRSDIDRRVREVLDLVGISELYGQYPHQMSGGQQQRVALARALVGGSPLVLFDEPLSNVDAKVREQLRGELMEMQQRIGFTAVYVTHDQEEALQLADRVAVIADGRIEQLGTPAEVYLTPSTRGIANFLGRMNQVRGSVASQSGDVAVLKTEIGLIEGRCSAPLAPGGSAYAVWRPERSTTDVEASSPNQWNGNVVESRFSGPYTETHVQVGDVELMHWGLGGGAPQPGDAVSLAVAPGDIQIFDDDSG